MLPPLEMTSMGSVKWCGGAAIVFHKAALPDLCAATTIPHSSFLISHFSIPPIRSHELSHTKKADLTVCFYFRASIQ